MPRIAGALKAAIVLVFLAVLAPVLFASGQSHRPVYADSSLLVRTFLDPEPGVLRDAYGHSLAALGDNILIGAPEADVTGVSDGAVYLVEASTGKQLLAVADPVPGSLGGFGNKLAPIGDDFVATKFGTAYSFDGSTGALMQTFANPNPPATDNAFGAAVAIVGSDVIIGADRDDTAGDDAGAAYIFDSATGALKRTLLHPDPGGPSFAGDAFGHNLAAFGDHLLIAAPHDDLGATSAGAVYLYDPADGTVIRTFMNPAPGFNDQFGIALATVGSKVMIGAPGDDTAGTNAGAAYLFDGETGALLQTFLSPTGEGGFGVAIAAVGDNFVIGAYKDDTAGPNAGAAYLFDQDGNLLATLLNPTPLDPHEGGFAMDVFGFPVLGLGLDIVVGAPFDDTAGTDAGAVYLFRNPLVPKPTATATPTLTLTPTPTITPPPPVGGIAVGSDLRSLALETDGTVPPPWDVVGIVAAACIIAAGGTAWYVRKRRA